MMVVAMVVMVVLDADPADVMVVPRLRRADIVLIADDLCAVFAELAIHRRPGVLEFGDALAERPQHTIVIAQIERLGELDFREQSGDGIGLRVDAFDQDSSEQEVRKHDYAAEAEPGRPGQCSIDTRMSDAAERDLGPAQTHALPQPARQYGNVG